MPIIVTVVGVEGVAAAEPPLRCCNCPCTLLYEVKVAADEDAEAVRVVSARDGG